MGPRGGIDVFKKEKYFTLARIATPDHPAYILITTSTTLKSSYFMHLMISLNKIKKLNPKDGI
jgi:hypothetical protein